VGTPLTHTSFGSISEVRNATFISSGVGFISPAHLPRELLGEVNMRRRVRPTYSICYSARAQTLSCAPNPPSVFARIFASVFTGGALPLSSHSPPQVYFPLASVGERTAPISTTMAKSGSDYLNAGRAELTWGEAPAIGAGALCCRPFKPVGSNLTHTPNSSQQCAGQFSGWSYLGLLRRIWLVTMGSIDACALSICRLSLGV
jgi:hypothetical protein